MARGCLKCIMIFINLFTILLGLGLMTLGIVALVKSDEYFPQPELDYQHIYRSSLKPIAIGLLLIGAALLFMAGVGCAGTITGKAMVLNFYFGMVLVLMLAECAVLIFGIIKRKEIAQEVVSSIDTLFTKTNNSTASETELSVVSSIQITLKCCGFDDGPEYWTRWDHNNKVPASCCGAVADPESASYYCYRRDPRIHVRPCGPVIERWWTMYIFWGMVGLMGTSIIVGFVSLAGARMVRRVGYAYEDEYTYTRYSEHDTASGTAKSSGFNTTWL